MTLHQVTIIMKKILIVISITFAGFMLIFFVFQLGILVKNALFPPKVELPNHLYGKLPKTIFPENKTDQQLTFTLNTITGGFPRFSDRLGVFPIFQPQPNFLNLNKAKSKVASLAFREGALNEIPLGGALYEWRESTGLGRHIIFNTITFDFTFESNYLSSSAVLNAEALTNEQGAILLTKDFLNELGLFPEDIDLAKTKTQLFSVQRGRLIPTTSLSTAQVIRADLYQKDVTYDLNTGVADLQGKTTMTPLTLPILYPHPPYSTMSFWVASELSDSAVMEANFVHKPIVIPSDTQATYETKRVQDAFEELKAGKAYIAAYDSMKTGKEISINNIYVGYYLSEDPQKYALPVFVFEGRNGFLAYVSAIKAEWME